jgi:hypothetical protein
MKDASWPGYSLLKTTTSTPVRYEEGKQLQLEIIQSRHHNLPPSQQVTAIILDMLSMTMSPVLEVVIRTSHGSPMHVVLKLYDRRFSKSLRHVRRKPEPHTPAHEEAFQDFIRRGIMDHSLASWRRKSKQSSCPRDLGAFFIVPPKVAASTRRPYGGSVGNDHFRCGTEAYTRIHDLEGESGWDEDEDWDPDVEYRERVSQQENPMLIRLVVGSSVKKAKGVKLDIK